MLRTRAALILACAFLAVAGPAGSAAATSLVDVEPANGATVQRAPRQVVLTFDGEVDPARTSVLVTPPRQQPRPARVEVDGARVVAEVPPAPAGEYLVAYEVAPPGASLTDPPTEGSVAFTVDPDVDPDAEPDAGAAGAGPWAVASAVALLGLLAALLVTFRRWQDR